MLVSKQLCIGGFPSIPGRKPRVQMRGTQARLQSDVYNRAQHTCVLWLPYPCQHPVFFTLNPKPQTLNPKP